MIPTAGTSPFASIVFAEWSVVIGRWLLLEDLRIENVLFANSASQRDVLMLNWGTPTRCAA